MGSERRDLRFSSKSRIKTLKTKLTSISPPLFVATSFLVSRLLYIRAGLRFDNTPLRYFVQLIDPQLLKNNLLESLWYLHSQPPLFNLVTGLLYQRFSPQSKVFQLLFFIMGLAFGLALYWLGLRLGLKPWVSALLAVWFTVSPATVLYENLYFYTYPVAFVLVLSALALSKFLETNNFWWGFGFFSLIASLCLTWALFHLFWMVAVIALVGVFYRDWRRLLLISSIPVIVVAGWYAKNSFLFGSFSASSWVGMNLSDVTFLSPLTPQAVRDELMERKEISPYPIVEAFRAIENYQGLLPVPGPHGIPILDQPLTSTESVNFNHVFYIGLSERMLKDALNFIRAHPRLYLASVRQGFSIFFHSSSDYLLLKDKPTPQLESLWDRIFYGQLSSYGEDPRNRWENHPMYVGWWLVIAYLAAVIYGLKLSFARDRSRPALTGVAAFMTFTIIFFALMANFLDLGENNRFRFALDPFVLLLFGLLIQTVIINVSRRREQRLVSPMKL